MSKVGRRQLLAASTLALVASGAASGVGPAVAAPAAAPARAVLSPELEQLTRSWRQLLEAEAEPSVSEAQIDAIHQQRNALLDRILAFHARSTADLLAKLRVVDALEPFAEAAEEGDVKAIWVLSVMADLERLTGPASRPR
jgi:hypothetical protein